VEIQLTLQMYHGAVTNIHGTPHISQHTLLRQTVVEAKRTSSPKSPLKLSLVGHAYVLRRPCIHSSASWL